MTLAAFFFFFVTNKGLKYDWLGAIVVLHVRNYEGLMKALTMEMKKEVI